MKSGMDNLKDNPVFAEHFEKAVREVGLVISLANSAGISTESAIEVVGTEARKTAKAALDGYATLKQAFAHEGGTS